MSDTEAPRIVDDVQQGRLTLEQDGGLAELVYRRNGRRLILVHTEVPERLEGLGIGGRLVQAAVQHAADEGLTLVPWCPFARTWLEGHPEVAAGVTIDWTPRPTRPGMA